ncbi:hypothetical protein HMPREF2899_04425 [Corynebacterium sp. HMSC072D01]|nr:hypothetical protein HMPREF2899_04425 [Corynebacterium sp. HMSC072D01]
MEKLFSRMHRPRFTEGNEFRTVDHRKSGVMKRSKTRIFDLNGETTRFVVHRIQRNPEPNLMSSIQAFLMLQRVKS